MNYILLRGMLIDNAPYTFDTPDKKLETEKVEEKFIQKYDGVTLRFNFPSKLIGKINILRNYSNLWEFRENKWFFCDDPIEEAQKKLNNLKVDKTLHHIEKLMFFHGKELRVIHGVDNIMYYLLAKADTFPCELYIREGEHKNLKKFPEIKRIFNRCAKKFSENENSNI